MAFINVFNQLIKFKMKKLIYILLTLIFMACTDDTSISSIDYDMSSAEMIESSSSSYAKSSSSYIEYIESSADELKGNYTHSGTIKVDPVNLACGVILCDNVNCKKCVNDMTDISDTYDCDTIRSTCCAIEYCKK